MLQAEVKSQIALGPETSYRGYQELGSNVTRFDGGFQRDHHEAIDLYKEETDRVLSHSPTCDTVPTLFCVAPIISIPLRSAAGSGCLSFIDSISL